MCVRLCAGREELLCRRVDLLFPRGGVCGFVSSPRPYTLLIGSVSFEQVRPHISAVRRQSPGIALFFAKGIEGSNFAAARSRLKRHDNILVFAELFVLGALLEVLGVTVKK